MTEPLREQALQSMIEILAAKMIGDRQWGGAYPNAVTVVRDYIGIDQINQYPHVCVVEAPGSTIPPELFTTVGAQLGVRHLFRVTLYGRVERTPEAARGTWLQRLWNDCWLTLMANMTLGGVAELILFDGEFDTDEGELDSRGEFSQGMTVRLYEAVDVEVAA